MALTYTTYVNSLVNLMPVPSAGDPGFQIALPNCIDDAEQRLYRELDLENSIVRDSSSTLTTNSRTFNLPTSIGTFIVTDEFNVITPSSTTIPENGTRNALVPASKEMLDMLWPSVTGSTVPQYFAPITQSTFIVGPWPDAAYTLEVVGTQRPAPISTTNVTTLLSVFFPDLLIAASMVFMSGYMKNYGAQVDDPQQGVSWETHLQKLIQSAQVEEMRKKFVGPAWSSKQPAPLATPPRT